MMIITDFDETWDLILENEIATADEMLLVCNINGRKKSVLDRIVYAKSGYRSIEQFIECEQ